MFIVKKEAFNNHIRICYNGSLKIECDGKYFGYCLPVINILNPDFTGKP
jgi:hypothetical protein